MTDISDRLKVEHQFEYSDFENLNLDFKFLNYSSWITLSSNELKKKTKQKWFECTYMILLNSYANFCLFETEIFK